MINSIAKPLEEIQPSIRGFVRHHEIDITGKTRHLIENHRVPADEKTRQLFLLRPLKNLDDGVQRSDAADESDSIPEILRLSTLTNRQEADRRR